MGENKAFLCYKKYRAIIDLLTDEQAGKLWKILFAFFDGWESPEIDDQAVALAFAIISQDMREKNEEWEATCEKNRESGKKGAKARWRNGENSDRHSDGGENSDRHSENGENGEIKENKIKENNNTPLTRSIDAETLVSAMPADIQEPMREWLKYKKERRQSYKEAGLKSLVKQVTAAVEKHGTEEVARVIRDCMASGYAGIMFDRMGKTGGHPPERKRTRFDNFESHGTDYDALMWAGVAKANGAE